MVDLALILLTEAILSWLQKKDVRSDEGVSVMCLHIRERALYLVSDEMAMFSWRISVLEIWLLSALCSIC